MRVPVSWLREYVAVEATAAELAARLGVSSLEVERIEHRGVPVGNGNLEHYRVGHVLEAGKHPNADRLQLCHVDVGEAEPRQIVCGAWNFGAGASVAVALPGAVLPGGQKLAEAKLRGERSSGMILSERELEIGTDHTGILLLSEEWDAGTPLADVLPLGDDVLEVDVTGNRPDLLSIYGVAREVAALFDAELAPPPGHEPEQSGDEGLEIAVEDLGGCPRYVGRLFREVEIAPSPPWLKSRLLAAGMRPILNVVDVTNYVMLALGNPLHAFDGARLAGGRIVVRRARPGEELRTLDGETRRLDPRDLVIADGARAVAIAGIMGGENSEVSPETTEVLLEAANFEPVGILKSSERLRLRTEGSNRWEKGVDPELAPQAAVLATQLIVELAGARWSGGDEVCGALPERPVVRLRPARASALIGLEVAPEEQRDMLERLGFEVEDDWTVTVPSWRARDVTREADLVEEVARFRLDDVPFTLPRRAGGARLSRDQRLRRLVEEVLVGCGFSEAYTWSLVPDDPDPAALRLPEPQSRDMAILRTQLLGGLVESALHNVNAGNGGVALFEIARVYLPTGGPLPDEHWHVGGVVEGGFARAKGAVETLYRALRVEPSFAPAPELLDRGTGARTAEGWVLELREPRLEGTWGAFELDLPALVARSPEVVVYDDVVTFPAVKQDLAFVVDEEVPAGALVAAAREAGAPELRSIRIFDVYRGEQVGPGRKSVAVAVEFGSPERTLSDEDAAEVRGRIVAAVAARHGATLRA
ncbi:MAG: phenylalanine--tRNA ligase subunit beta [Actinobacteria bacterium]|nr:phenylalanine--tRNA ligase subunit beta [Actinomycetota bacterium]